MELCGLNNVIMIYDWCNVWEVQRPLYIGNFNKPQVLILVILSRAVLFPSFDHVFIMKIIHKQALKPFIIFCILTLIFFLIKALVLRNTVYVLHHGLYSPVKAGLKFLSYQPGGQGWNNQRIVLEHAVVFAKLLNRTLIVHPVSEHPLGQDMTINLKIKGYEAYNLMNKSNLLPISKIIDLHHLSNLVPIIENIKPHNEFLRDFSHLSRIDVCHSVAYGYWVDRRAETSREEEIIENQFFREKKDMLGKCKSTLAKSDNSVPMLRYIFPDLSNDNSDLLYFSEGTLFAIDVRFFSKDLALASQHWISSYIKYHPDILATVNTFISDFPGNYCCIHARRTGYSRSYLTWRYYLELADELGCKKGSLLYIATDLLEKEFFDHFNSYQCVNSTSLIPLINYNNIPFAFNNTLLGIHEQMVCIYSAVFIPSNQSTLTYYVSRVRREIPMKDGLHMKHVYFYYMQHYLHSIVSKYFN